MLPVSRSAQEQTHKHASRKVEDAPAAADTETPEQQPDVILAAPYWSTADGFVSTIEMKNYHVSKPITATPVLHLDHGGEIALAPITLKPSETRLLNINRELTKRSQREMIGAAEIRHIPEGAFGANLTVLNAPSGYLQSSGAPIISR